MARLLSVDIDLHRVHCWDSTNEAVVCVDSTMSKLLTELAAIDESVTLIVECGSTHTYGDKILKKKMAWLIYNSIMVGKLDSAIWQNESLIHVNMLVSPSSTWTHGFDEKKRHLWAKTQPVHGYTKDQNHNIEECQCMAHFYTMNPDDWVPLKEFIKCL